MLALFDLKMFAIFVLVLALYLQTKKPQLLSGFLPKCLVGLVVGFTVVSEVIVVLHGLLV
ncbi:hypothetical protein ACQRD4_09950 [Streptococcus hyointestinalis]|uniref:Uncharacterized protein n=1 Tax=Streptococcus hyointestinalis TaxID=1337 RepID=A0A380K3I2_9STRE|nr:hypothetical protein [Streptococcus hyointestinalis]SUN59606.1 Uncharacterised protein [Streptococcus hyointestinalis]